MHESEHRSHDEAESFELDLVGFCALQCFSLFGPYLAFVHFSGVLYQTFDLISNNSSYIVRLDMGRAHIARRRYLNGLVWLASLPFGQSTHITNPTFEMLPTLHDGLKAVFVAWVD